MSQDPLAKFHKDCKTRKLFTFADGQSWCETCGKYIEIAPEPAPVRPVQGVTWTTKILK